MRIKFKKKMKRKTRIIRSYTNKMNRCATSVVRHTATIPNLETNKKKINKNVYFTV